MQAQECQQPLQAAKEDRVEACTGPRNYLALTDYVGAKGLCAIPNTTDNNTSKRTNVHGGGPSRTSTPNSSHRYHASEFLYQFYEAKWDYAVFGMKYSPEDLGKHDFSRSIIF